MSSSSYVFIVNPKAGNGSTGSDWPVIRQLAEERLGPFESFFTQSPGDAERIAAEAIGAGARQIVCVGGDGTLNEVVNGCMASDDAVRSDLQLGFIPDGTGCDFIRTVPIPQDLGQAVDAIARGEILKIDVGRLFFQDHHGRRACRYFHNLTSFGLGGEVDERVNRTTKAFGPFCSFIWATLISIFQYGKKRITISIDDHAPREYTVWNVAVANGQFHGGGMRVAPDALIDDGLLHVTVIGDLSLGEVFANLPRLYNGRITQLEKVETFVGKKVHATSRQKVLLDVDGEQPGSLPAEIGLLPGALRLIV